MPVDYSKFDKVDVSDEDEVKKETATKPVSSLCGSCGKNPSAPLRCGNCKSQIYCSAECQKGDWQFHKRLCSKPKPIATTSNEPQKKEPIVSKSTTEKVEDDEEKLDWYRHRSWKAPEPSNVKPVRLETPAELLTQNLNGKSAWNAADTWEEKDVTVWAKDWILKEIPGSSAVEGDASLPFVRGQKRFLFDFKFTWKFQDSDLIVQDFSDDQDTPTLRIPKHIDSSEAINQITSQRSKFFEALRSL